MRIAICHDWLLGMRGGEKCLEAFLEIFPDSDIYTLFYDPSSVSKAISSRPVHASFLSKLPNSKKIYKNLLPLYPAAARSFDIKGYDAVVSMNHCVAKSFRIDPAQPQLCYCFTPMRYAWLFFDEYWGNFSGPAKVFIRAFLSYLRGWDKKHNVDVTQFIGISEHVRERIKNFYGRDALVIYPPVDTEFYTQAYKPRKDFYLVVSALVPYKKLELAIEACRTAKKKLVVVGTGPMEERLKKIAGPETEFRGWCSQEEIRDLYRTCRALLFPGEEDFGIVPVEAQSCGAPVVAYKMGATLETVLDGVSGVFFEQPTVAALIEAMKRLERTKFESGLIRVNAERFSILKYQESMTVAVKNLRKPANLSRVYS